MGADTFAFMILPGLLASRVPKVQMRVVIAVLNPLQSLRATGHAGIK